MRTERGTDGGRRSGLATGTLGNLAEAMADYSRAIELDPGFAMAYLRRAHGYEFMSENQKAKEDYRRVLSLTDDLNLTYAAEDGLERLGAD